jgi:hypothetical protein
VMRKLSYLTAEWLHRTKVTSSLMLSGVCFATLTNQVVKA